MAKFRQTGSAASAAQVLRSQGLLKNLLQREKEEGTNNKNSTNG